MTKGERIRSLRKAKGITQLEMARLLRTTKQTISKYEKGIVTNIPSDRVEAMARLLDTTPEYILGWDMLEQEKPVEGDGLPEDMQTLIDYVRANVPEDKAPLALRVLRSIVEDDQ